MMQNYSSLQETHDDEQAVLVHEIEPTRSRWNHIEDLDSFFSRIYRYHQRHGFRCMLLQDLFNISQFVFIIFLTLWLIHGINYDILFNPTAGQKPRFSDIIRSFNETIDDFTTLTWFCVIFATLVFMCKVFNKFYQNIQYWDIKQFYNTALEIQDDELDNLNWHEIQTKLRIVQLEHQMCIHKRELTELDIYHRILRQENYMVALINKRLFPPRYSLPGLGNCVYWSKALRFNVQCLLFWSPWSPFENPWHLREEYKRANLRHELANRLGKQILWLAFINIVFAPIILIWEMLYTFFNYAEMMKREPGKIGIRKWSLYGKLYLRHFNELDHELNARLTRAYRPATKYMSAFSSPVVTITAQHIAFLCGSLFAVIVSLTLYDEDVIGVENLLTLMTALGALVAVCRNIIPEESMVWCPETLLQAVVVHTHYMTPDWKSHAHTSRVRDSFEQLFQYRFVALIEELISPILTPYFLLRWVYPRRLEIVDFFRNFTVSVMGVGDVCSFAQMDVKKHGNPEWQKESMYSSAPTTADLYSQAEDGKVELSLVHFTTTNPKWIPPPEAQSFVDNIMDDEMPQLYSDSDVYGSFQNLMENSNLHTFSHQALPNLRATRATLGSMVDSTSGTRKSVWKAEGPNMFGPIAMRQSVIALHDRYEKQAQRQARSEETTPLLIQRSF